jgi:uncharacterized LabA/DUF88 family protein
MAFADGENLVMRYQDMVKAGCIPNPAVAHVRDVLIWHPDIMEQFVCDAIRVSYYQTVVGDESKLNSVRQQIADVRFSYQMAGHSDISWSGSLAPRVFKKEGRTSKSKSVDINLAVDVLRHARDPNVDIVFMLSGDGDYLPLIEELSRCGKQVWLAAFSKGLNPALRYSADEFMDLDSLVFVKN